MRKSLFISVLAIFILSGCRGIMGKRIHGDGNIKTENIATGKFSNIDVSGAVDVIIKQDSVSSVKLETDENLADYVEIEVKGQTLQVEQKNGWDLRPTRGIKIYITNPSFRKIHVSGACDITSTGRIENPEELIIHMSGATTLKMDVRTPKVSADLNGASKLSLKGETKDFTLEGSGASNIKGYELMAENIYVRLSGASTADMFASVKLDAHLSGAADVNYKGNPTVIKQVSGAANVRKVE